MDNHNASIIFFGTPEFSIPALSALINGGYQISAVICQPDKPAGRNRKITASPVKIFAKERGILVLQPNKLQNTLFIKQIRDLNADLIVVVAYGKLIPNEIINIPKFKAINIHPSLLPIYRGPSPIQSAILNGDKKTGITIMMINEKMDSGDILSQQTFDLNGTEKADKLSKILSEKGAELLVKTIPDYICGKIKPQKQNEKDATYTKLITKRDGEIEFEKETAEEIERKIRAFFPWPATYTKLKTKNKNPILLKLIKVSVTKCDDKKSVGEIFLYENKKPAVKCQKDCLVLETVQPEGKKPMSGLEFWNGYSKKLQD